MLKNVVLNESSEALGNHLEIVRILVLAMTTATDRASGYVVLSDKLLLVFCCFIDKMVLFWCRLLGSLKTKQLVLVSKFFLTNPYVTSRDLQVRKPY